MNTLRRRLVLLTLGMAVFLINDTLQADPAGIRRAWWTGISGVNITSLTSNANFPMNPDGRDTLSRLEAVSWSDSTVTMNWAETYGEIVYGYLIAPVTGQYTFWLACDDYGELWLSTDQSQVNMVKIASVYGWTGQYVWDKYSSQKSATIDLVAGQKYYLQVLHKENTGGDNMAVAWDIPGDTSTTPAVIHGQYLTYDEYELVPAFDPQPVDNAAMVSSATSLKWDYHSLTTHQKVYFGTESNNLELIHEFAVSDTGDGTASPAANPVFWLDASNMDTLTIDANQKVSRWDNVTGDGNYAVQTDAAKQPAYNPGATINGKSIVNFGPALSDYTGMSMQFMNADGANLNISAIRTVFWVLKGGNFLLGDDNTYHFHRATPETEATSNIWHATYTHVNIKNGSTWLNGSPVNGSGTPLPENYSVISLVTTGNVEASNLCSDRNRYRSGGQQIAEIIIYDRALTDQERRETEAYLNFKWFGGTIETAECLPTPSPLAKNTRYFWRVDVTMNGQEIRGRQWSFETEPNPVTADELGFDEIIFNKHVPLRSDHYYTYINNGTPSSVFSSENGLYLYNVRTGQERPVITAADIPGSGKGIINKFTLSFDATKAVFDYRDNTGAGFRIWECNLDGSGLRQVLQPPVDEAEKIYRWNHASNFHTDDVEPAYLPDGSIIFSSSRCEHTILCGGSAHLVAPVLHRMNPDGSGLEQLSRSLVSEFCPTVLADGRVMYHRWEYIDKGHRTPKTIWTMNPDGSKSQELFGISNSYYNTGSHMFPQEMPGNDGRIVFVSAQHYPQGNVLGPIQIFDLNKDNRSSAGLTNITPDVRMGSAQEGWYFSFDNFSTLHLDGVGGPLYSYPYPINPTQILVTYKQNWNNHYRDIPGAYSIFLIDLDGKHRYVYRDPDGTTSCWQPTPVVPRPEPPVIYGFRHPTYAAQNQAQCIMVNVYEGMDGVEPGEIKWLRINEAIPRYWDTGRRWSNDFTSNSWYSALWTRVQWGVVPVEPDGSANFMVPADRNIFFQALDEDFREIQRERTYVNYKPGEIRSCTGCHEQTGRAASTIPTEAPLAVLRSPSQSQPQPCDLAENGGDGRPEQVIHYPTDIQPIFDKNCITCHSGATPSGSLDLSGTLTNNYSISYQQLLSKEIAGRAIPEFSSITPGVGGGNDNGDYLPPRSLGCYSSKNKLLPKMLTTDIASQHYKLLTDIELMRLCRWMDTNYQFYSTYYGKHSSYWSSDPHFRRRPTFEEATSMYAPEWHR